MQAPIIQYLTAIIHTASHTMSHNDQAKITTWGSGGFFQHRALGSLIIMVLTPLMCMSLCYACTDHNGSLSSLYEEATRIGFITIIREKIWLTPFDPFVMKGIAIYMIYQLVLMKLVPGKTFYATPAPSGHVPEYKANCIQCYIINIATLFSLARLNIIDPSLWYDNLGNSYHR